MSEGIEKEKGIKKWGLSVVKKTAAAFKYKKTWFQ